MHKTRLLPRYILSPRGACTLQNSMNILSPDQKSRAMFVTLKPCILSDNYMMLPVAPATGLMLSFCPSNKSNTKSMPFRSLKWTRQTQPPILNTQQRLQALRCQSVLHKQAAGGKRTANKTEAKEKARGHSRTALKQKNCQCYTQRSFPSGA